jgi:hypothetical protein
VYRCILNGSPDEVAATVSFPPTQTRTIDATLNSIFVANKALV